MVARTFHNRNCRRHFIFTTIKREKKEKAEIKTTKREKEKKKEEKNI